MCARFFPETAARCRRNQHAFGEESLPDAHQEHSPNLYRRNWFSITSRDLMVVMCCLLWSTPRSGPSGFCSQSAARSVEAPPDSIQSPGGSRLHGELVPIRAGQ